MFVIQKSNGENLMLSINVSELDHVMVDMSYTRPVTEPA